MVFFVVADYNYVLCLIHLRGERILIHKKKNNQKTYSKSNAGVWFSIETNSPIQKKNNNYKSKLINDTYQYNESIN